MPKYFKKETPSGALFWGNIEVLIGQLGVGYYTFARIHGFNPKTITAGIKNKRFPTNNRVLNMSKALGVTYDSMFRDLKSGEQATPYDDYYFYEPSDYFWYNINQLRVNKGVSWKEVAESIGVTYRALEAPRNSHKLLKGEHVESLIEYFGVTCKDLFSPVSDEELEEFWFE